jgi:hypothetical protein
MKTKRFWMLVVIASIFMLSAVGHSEAACTTYGKVVYSYTNGGTCWVYVTPNTALPLFYYYFTTTDPEVIAAVNAAQAGNLKVYAIGNATACPTSGSYRYGGVVSWFYTYSLF